MLNPEAAALVAGSDMPEGSLHDWWAYLVVSAAGGAMVTDDVPVVLYRQHGANAIGAPASRVRRAGAALARGPRAFMALLRAHVAALLAQPHLLSPAAAADLARIDTALRGGLLVAPRLPAPARLAPTDGDRGRVVPVMVHFGITPHAAAARAASVSSRKRRALISSRSSSLSSAASTDPWIAPI